MPLVRHAGAESFVRRNSILIVYRSEQSWRADERAWCLRRRSSVEWEELSSDELRQFDPSLSRDLVRARLAPRNGHAVDPGGLVAALARAVEADGGRPLLRRATGFALDGGRLRAVQTPEGDVAADAGVIAADAYSNPSAALLGDRVPLETERGCHAMIREPEAMPRLPTTDADFKFVATPMNGGLRLAASTQGS
jgi:D-amino-acid dehydrogenase